MAAAAQPQNLEEEVTCSICLEYFKNPVIIGCGHIFCESCISCCWQGSDTNFACPQCREMSQERKFQPIRQLGNLAEMLKHHLSSLKPQENVCEKHQQRLQLFCEDDQEPICVVCDRSRDHRSHTVIPVEEAAQECKKKLQSRLIQLRSNLEEVNRFTTYEEKNKSELEGEFQSQAEKATRTFEDLQQFLEQEKKNKLCKLEKEQAEHLQKISQKITALEKQKASFKDLIEEIEGKCHQQDVELLKGVRIILNRSESVKVQLPKNDSVESYMQSLRRFSSQHAYIQDKIREFKEALTLDAVTAVLKTGSQKPARSIHTALPKTGFQKSAKSIDTAKIWQEFDSLTSTNTDQNLEMPAVEPISPSPLESIKTYSEWSLYDFSRPVPMKKTYPPKKPVKRTDEAQLMMKEDLDFTKKTF